MRIAVFSDIHSNLSAFSASLAYAKHLGAEGYAFLGDLITDCPDPHALLTEVRKLAETKPCWFVRGNREESMLQHRKNPDEWTSGTVSGSLLYTYEQLTDDDMRFLEQMQRTSRIEIDGCPQILMCHASPNSTRDILYPGSELTDKTLKNISESTFLSGHCHVQYRYESSGKQLINPGSLGIHNNGQTKAQFALIRFEDGRWIARMMNVEYDRIAELKRFEDSGLMEMGGIYSKLILNCIRTGQYRFHECLALATQLSAGDKSQPVDELAMTAAAKQLGII